MKVSRTDNLIIVAKENISDIERRGTATLNPPGSNMSLHSSGQKDKEDGFNMFKANKPRHSESSDGYTFISGARFGGAITNSDRGSIIQPSINPNF